ncbi:hypothetical protein NLG97_g2644 [Lecanicillium saksenae]|uniref:Uncharacterized protein n=1 Tax=Lecanicillium saksenae TaxID=468837 RepID=A0ACC1R3M2_9HYPO|nr:hypothetical protein NLG97_g2644 [Lecanicillium saksenae]
MSGAEVLGIISAVISIVDATIKVYDAAKDEAGLPPNFKTQLFKNVIAAEGDSSLVRYVKAARTVGKGGRVETLMKAILDDLQLLTTKFPKAVSRRGLESLTEAIEDVSRMEPSLPDGFENAPAFTNYGNGTQNVNTGAGGFHSHQNNGPVHSQFVKAAPHYRSEEYNACLRDLFITDPLDDKREMKRKKGDRVAGTCEWIFGTKELTAWLEPDEVRDSVSHATQVLWLHGNPGTGKSTLAMYLTDALYDKLLTADGCSLAYFFCDSAFAAWRTATSVIRGLL